MERGRHHRLRQRILLAVRACAALLVLFAITADILADSRCDPVARASVGASLRSSTPSGEQDPCNTACVADCYCCAHSMTRGAAVLPPDAGPATAALPLLPPAAPAGVRPIPYRPPVRLA